ncbi:hypothetical protein [Mucilaginibacter myungsuensis]|uniref:Lipoprotein n=1 Tax=Mucilaginibacter myungsuensis TaxID=649104 RepID=A0A929PWD6_9SPHI|nr:hypothetical protein [Mucilaginibacter myungsuensis]MBE9661072.1 hypothetical protein [Mucilaginibacter myungsuensis]MDN3597216.1 hypothetical protein [Mucilaginibacter myungsuensis]
MKKEQTFILAIMLLVMAAACKRNRHQYVTSDGHNRLEAVYSGKIIFDEDRSIGRMSRHSYFMVNKNGDQIEVQCDNKGKITYTDDNGHVKTKPDQDDKQLLAEGVKLILNTQRGVNR